MISSLMSGSKQIAVVGLGYVGLPLAVAFSQVGLRVIGYDCQSSKIACYRKGKDVTGEVGDDALQRSGICFTDDPAVFADAVVYIIAVPTPVDNIDMPDFSQLIGACEIVGAKLSRGDYVIFESTVYPGATEEICVPILERASGLAVGRDFKIGYSPERINPGDRVHTLKNISKIVSASDEEALTVVKDLYELIIDAEVHPVSSIQTAEAIKITENTQRDVNIAFMNEMALLYHKLGIDTKEVIDGMNTKWNHLEFRPGLVGGHCIGVDPYYLIYAAEKNQNTLDIVKSSRKVNETVSQFIVSETANMLLEEEPDFEKCRVCVFGITFKENCSDIRNSKVIDIVKGLSHYGVRVFVVDPLADRDETKKMYGIDLCEMSAVHDVDCVVAAVAHDCFKFIQVDEMMKLFSDRHRPILIDIKGMFYKNEYIRHGYRYFSL